MAHCPEDVHTLGGTARVRGIAPLMKRTHDVDAGRIRRRSARTFGRRRRDVTTNVRGTASSFITSAILLFIGQTSASRPEGRESVARKAARSATRIFRPPGGR